MSGTGNGSGTERPIWFLGDLDDPWSVEIADALPGPVVRFPAGAGWPETESSREASRSAEPRPASTRATLDDAARPARGRARWNPMPRTVLCVGPYARQAELERWLGLVDAIVPEATARETIARHVRGVEPALRPPGPRPRIQVVSTNFELRRALADAIEVAGYPAEILAGWSDADSTGPCPAIWDVPVLEPDWSRTLARRARLGPVVALLGFADRGLVTAARAAGAAACLDLPCDLADLIGVLDRLQAPRGELAHVVPPPPVGRGRASRGDVG